MIMSLTPPGIARRLRQLASAGGLARSSFPAIIFLMKSVGLAVVAGSLALVLGGCGRGLESQEAVRQAILDHLSKRGTLNLNSMQVDVVSVVFRQNEADATVSFRIKGSQGGPGMTMNYTLEKQGNRWVVKGRSDSAGSPHGAMGQMPGGMPAGHPPIGGAQPPETKK